MKLKSFTEISLKKIHLPSSWQLIRQKIALFAFFILLIIYLFTLLKIRSIYGEPLSLFSKNNPIKTITDNFSYDINSDEVSDNVLTIRNNTDNQFIMTPINTLTPTLTTKPTVKPTTKVNPPTPKPNTPTPTAASGCPLTTQRCVPCIAGETSCRVEAGQTHGFKGWACQNNNPGNIRPGSSKNIMIQNNGGTPPCGERSGYMVFRTYDEGKNGLKAYLRGISNGQHSAYKDVALGIYCGECNLQFFFNKYAPAGDQNDPASYANYVANRIGVSSSTTMLSWIVANKLDAMADAIQTHEGWFTN